MHINVGIMRYAASVPNPSFFFSSSQSVVIMEEKIPVVTLRMNLAPIFFRIM